MIAQELTDRHHSLSAAIARHTDRVEQLLAGARAYLAYGQAHSNRYRVIFERRGSGSTPIG